MPQNARRTAIRRMTELRKAQGFTTERLAAAMTEHGVPWKRDVVTALERGRRERLDVDELLALAAVLGVPPAALLVDPSSTTTTIGRWDVPTAQVLMWMAGLESLERVVTNVTGEPGVFTDAAAPIRLASRLRTAVGGCQVALLMVGTAERQAAQASADDLDQRRLELEQRTLVTGLRELGGLLEEMHGVGMAPPPVPGLVELAALAAEQGITLEHYDDGGA